MIVVTKKILAVLSVLIFTISFPSQAGFFDDMVNKALDAVSDTAEDVMSGDDDSQQQNKQPQSTVQKPAYDRSLVASIQRELNRVGHNVGTVDGAYGPGTSRAIQGFQRDQGMVVDGVPTHALLQRLKSQPGRQASEVQQVKPIKMASSQNATTGISVDQGLMATLDKYEIQGIKLGIKLSEAATVLTNTGYIKIGINDRSDLIFRKKESNDIGKKIWLNRGEALSDVVNIRYLQNFPKSTYLDIKAVGQKIKQKYGNPDREKSRKGGEKIMLEYYLDNSKRDNMRFDLISDNGRQKIMQTLDSERLRVYVRAKDNRRRVMIQEQRKAEAERARKNKPAASVDF